MLDPIIRLMADSGTRLPEARTREDLDKAVDDFVLNAFKTGNREVIDRLNQIINVDLDEVAANTLEKTGPYCGILGMRLEANCSLRECRKWDPEFTLCCSKLGERLEQPSMALTEEFKARVVAGHFGAEYGRDGLIITGEGRKLRLQLGPIVEVIDIAPRLDWIDRDIRIFIRHARKLISRTHKGKR